MDSPVGLIMEGRRRNILPSNPLTPPSCVSLLEGGDFVGLMDHPRFPSLPVLKFRLKKDVAFQLRLTVPCPEKHFGYTVSYFASINVKNPVPLKSCLGDENERICRIAEVSNEVRRFEFAHYFAQPPQKLNVVISFDKKIVSKFPNTTDFIFALPSIEEGLFASTPIPKSNEWLGERDGEQCSYKRKKNFFSG